MFLALAPAAAADSSPTTSVLDGAGETSAISPDEAETRRHIRPASAWEPHRNEIIALVLALVVQSGFIIALIVERRRRQLGENSLRQFASSTIAARDEERRRLARELHDTTGQNIALASLLLGSLKPTLDESQSAKLGEIEDALRKSAQEIRTLSYVLHPPFLEEAGLRQALPHFVGEFMRRSGVKIGLEIDPELPRLEPAAELAAFRVIQEALTNVARHSGSASAAIRLQGRGSGADRHVRLTIEDYGSGFPNAVAARRAIRQEDFVGVGLASMRERLSSIGGELDVTTGVGKTTVIGRIPLQAQV